MAPPVHSLWQTYLPLPLGPELLTEGPNLVTLWLCCLAAVAMTTTSKRTATPPPRARVFLFRLHAIPEPPSLLLLPGDAWKVAFEFGRLILSALLLRRWVQNQWRIPYLIFETGHVVFLVRKSAITVQFQFQGLQKGISSIPLEYYQWRITTFWREEQLPLI